MKTNPYMLLVRILFIFFVSITMPFVSAQATGSSKPFVVVLDAGHGGHDSGNVGNGHKESNIALQIVLKVGERLKKTPNYKVLYTRTTNTFVTLKERADVANKADADLFVSVHCDAFTSSSPYGAGTFVLGMHRSQDNFEIAKKENEVIFLEENYEETYAGFDPNSPESFIGLTILQEEYLDQSLLLASLVQNNFTNTLKRKNRKVKQAGFLVLRETYMPSVLIETGFLTNKKEGAYLNSKKGQEEMAREIAKGVISYKESLDLATGDFQNPTITEQEIDEAIISTEKKIYEGVTFRVQIAATKNKVETKSYNFKGLKDIERTMEGELYRYYYGSTSDYNQIQLMQTFAKEKGYPSCYIVAFKEGEKLKLSEVLKTEDK